MKLGSRIFLILILIIFSSFLNAEQKIITAPLINIDEIKPSFENLDNKNENVIYDKKLKDKKNLKSLKSSQAILIGLRQDYC